MGLSPPCKSFMAPNLRSTVVYFRFLCISKLILSGSDAMVVERPLSASLKYNALAWSLLNNCRVNRLFRCYKPTIVAPTLPASIHAVDHKSTTIFRGGTATYKTILLCPALGHLSLFWTKRGVVLFLQQHCVTGTRAYLCGGFGERGMDHLRNSYWSSSSVFYRKQ